MDRDEVVRRLALHRADLAKFGVKNLSLFGSVARRDAGPESDVDLLVEFLRPIGLFGFIEVQRFLSDLLRRRAIAESGLLTVRYFRYDQCRTSSNLCAYRRSDGDRRG